MALDYKGIVFGGSVITEASELGYPQTGTSFSDPDYNSTPGSTVIIPKSTVEDTTGLLTFGNIMDTLDTDFIAMGNQYDVTNTVEVYALLNEISLNDGGKYSDDGTEYTCKYELYVKIS